MTTLFSKAKDSILILILISTCPTLINNYIYQLKFHHYLGFYLISLAAIIHILTSGLQEADKITQVLESKKIEINGLKPIKVNRKEC